MTSPSRNNLLDRLDRNNFPLASFKEVAKAVSKTSNRSKNYNRYAKLEVSPRQEIYKSMLREIRSTVEPHMNSLVHKASGILRLNHYKNLNKTEKVVVSWDADGRRVLTYEGKGGISRTALERETIFDKSSKKTLLESLNQPIFGLNFQNFKVITQDYDTNNNRINSTGAADCERGISPVSKIWEEYIDTGDSSKLWESKEAIIPRPLRTRHHHHHHRERSHSRMSDSSGLTSGSLVSKTTDSAVSYISPVPHKSHVKPSRDRIKSWEATKTLWGTPKLADGAGAVGPEESISNSDLSKSKSRPLSQPHRKDMDEKVDRVLHLCVVNGSVVTFKDFGFENFTNWFGDESTLEANQQRCQPSFHLELDLAHVESKDIKIRYLDGYKLEIEAKRRIEGSKKPLRLKEFLYIPRGYRAEDLLLCRTKAGKIVVEDLTSEPVEIKSLSTLTQNEPAKISKSKINLHTGKERKRFRL